MPLDILQTFAGLADKYETYYGEEREEFLTNPNTGEMTGVTYVRDTYHKLVADYSKIREAAKAAVARRG